MRVILVGSGLGSLKLLSCCLSCSGDGTWLAFWWPSWSQCGCYGADGMLNEIRLNPSPWLWGFHSENAKLSKPFKIYSIKILYPLKDSLHTRFTSQRHNAKFEITVVWFDFYVSTIAQEFITHYYNCQRISITSQRTKTLQNFVALCTEE